MAAFRGELLGGLLASESVMRRQYGRILELIAEAESRSVAVGQGYRDTAALLAMALRISRNEAKARVAQATTPIPLATKALQAGDIGPEHVHEIQKVLAQAPATLPAEDRDQREETLVELALRADPVAVQRAGRRLLRYWDLEERPPKDEGRTHDGRRVSTIAHTSSTAAITMNNTVSTTISPSPSESSSATTAR